MAKKYTIMGAFVILGLTEKKAGYPWNEMYMEMKSVWKLGNKNGTICG